MKKNDIEINAYVDGELSQTERADVLSAMQQDPDLAREACELSNLKSQLQVAYAKPPGPTPYKIEKTSSTWLSVAASLMFLSLGLVSGWMIGADHLDNDQNRVVLLDAEGLGKAPAIATNDETRIVFHITSNPEKIVAEELLDDIERMLKAYQKEGKPLRVEIVSNSTGLDFLRERLSASKARINALATNYENLTFVACNNSIKRVEVLEGIEVKIIPGANIIDSGVTHVVKRQKEGWTYIRV